MKYRKKNIDDVFRNKNWEGLQGFVDKFGLDCLILLDRIVQSKDLEKLKEYVKTFSIEPLLEYGMPVAGEGVKEFYDISDRYHAHKHKTGAEWWVRDEFKDAVRQLKGYAAEPAFLDNVALLWKEVDARIEAPARTKINAFRKILIATLVSGLFKAETDEEKQTMDRIETLFNAQAFKKGIRYRHDFSE